MKKWGMQLSALISFTTDNFDITFNSKKPVCIQFGEQTRQYETIKLNNKIITWVDNIKHLGNYFDTTMSDKMDCQSKISAFTGSVNKLNVNFGHLQGNVLSTLFKLYCCSYYSCQMWKLDSLAFRGYVHLGIEVYALFYICLLLLIRIC